MRNTTSAWMLAAGIAAIIALPACTQMPTEKHSVSDLRPEISFKTDSDRARVARVMVDSMDVGAVADYLEGAAAVRVLPGTHRLRVVAGSDVLLDEKIYLGDGVSRTFSVK